MSYANNTYNDRSLYPWAARTNEATWYCENPDSHLVFPNDLLSGSQTITVEPVLFNVTASTQYFQAGDTVHFTVQTELAATGVSWTFHYTGGQTLSLTACSNQFTCDFVPADTGRMEAALVENLTNTTVAARSDEVFLTGRCPTTQDPILDSRAFQDAINAEFLQSAAADKEFAGWILKNRTTGNYSVRRFDVFYNDRCSSFYPVDLETVPGDTIVATYHTHMWPVGAKYGTKCRLSDPEARATNGPSPDYDLKKSTGLTYRLPDYIIDYDEMFRVNVNTTFQTWPWTHVNGCRRG